MMYKDSPGQYDNVKKTDGERKVNNGFVERSNLVTGGRQVELTVKLDLDFCQRGRLIPPQTEISISFKHAKDSFRIMCNSGEKEMKVVFDEIKLRMYRNYLEPEIFNQLMSEMRLNPAVYDYHRFALARKIFPIGTPNFVETLFNNDRVPEVVYIFFVDSDAIGGDYLKNPLKFNDLGIKQVTVIFFVFFLFRNNERSVSDLLRM
jgi:hypothetical protein